MGFGDHGPKKEGGGFKANALKAVGGVLDILDRPANAIRSGSVAVRQSGNPLSFLSGAGKGLVGAEHTSVEDFTKQGLGIDLPKNPFLKGASEFAIGAAFDPTTYLSLGGKTAAEGAVKEAATALAEKTTKEGLDYATRQGAKNALTTLGEDVGKGGFKTVYNHISRDELKDRLIQKQLTAGADKGITFAKASKNAEKALSQAEQFGKGGISLHVPGTNLTHNVVSGAKLKDVAEAAHLAPVARAVKESGAGKFAARLLKPRAAIEQSLGKEVAQQVGAAGIKSRAVVETLKGRDASELNAARKLVKATPEDSQLVARAISEKAPQFTAQESARLKELQPLTNAAQRISQRTTSTLVKQHLLPKVEAKTALQHALTPETEKIMQTPAGKKFLNAAVENAKKTLPEGWDNLSAGQINKIMEPGLKQAGLLKEGEHYLEPGVINPVAKSSEAAAESVGQKKLVTELSTIKDPSTGKGLVLNATQDAPANYVEKNLGPLGKLKVHPDIAPEIDRVNSIITNDKDLSQLGTLYNKWNQWWKSAATVLPVGGSFTGRNARSNIFLNYLAGVTSPRVYKEAGGIQKVLFKLDHNKEAQAYVAEHGFESAVNKYMTKRQASYYREARGQEIFGTSFANEDLRAGDLVRPESSKKVTALKKAKEQLGTNSKAIKVGAEANALVENNARLAHFISKRESGSSVAEAAASVKKHLFDYGDLTNAERKVVKKVIPFYTFMRKNTPLIFEQLIKNPGKFTIPEHLKEAFFPNVNQETTPTYLRNGHQLPPAIAKLLGINDPNIGITNADNVLASFEDQGVKPIASALSLVPGGHYLVPKTLAPADKGEAARNILNIASGPVPELGKFLTGEATGKNVFTGGTADTSANALLKALTPAAGRAQAITGGKGSAQTKLLKALTGLSVSEQTPKQAKFVASYKKKKK